jgi:hypothetical protein
MRPAVTDRRRGFRRMMTGVFILCVPVAYTYAHAWWGVG